MNKSSAMPLVKTLHIYKHNYKMLKVANNHETRQINVLSSGQVVNHWFELNRITTVFLHMTQYWYVLDVVLRCIKLQVTERSHNIINYIVLDIVHDYYRFKKITKLEVYQLIFIVKSGKFVRLKFHVKLLSSLKCARKLKL